MTVRRVRRHLSENEHDALRRALRQLRNAPRPHQPLHLGAWIVQAFAENA